MSVRDHKIACSKFTKFSEHVAFGCGSVFQWQYNVLCFVDDVMFVQYRPCYCGTVR